MVFPEAVDLHRPVGGVEDAFLTIEVAATNPLGRAKARRWRVAPRRAQRGHPRSKRTKRQRSWRARHDSPLEARGTRAEESLPKAATSGSIPRVAPPSWRARVDSLRLRRSLAYARAVSPPEPFALHGLPSAPLAKASLGVERSCTQARKPRSAICDGSAGLWRARVDSNH